MYRDSIFSALCKLRACISPAEIIVGFSYEEMTFEASTIGNATMLVFGEALQSFTVNYIQGISQIEIMYILLGSP